MTHFQNILLALTSGAPGYWAALQRAAFVARAHGAALAVAGMVGARFPQRDREREPDALRSAVMRACHETVEYLANTFRATGIPITTAVLSGTPFHAIICEVLRRGHDLVITTADAAGGIGNALFGSTPAHLVRKCPCPVWLLNAAERVPYRRVLAAVDVEREDPDEVGFNRKILDVAGAVAEMEDAELHLAHAWNLEFEDVLRTQLRRSVWRGLLRERRTRRMAALWRLAANIARGRRHRIHLRKGLPSQVIPSLARREKMDLVVMGAAARTGVAKLLAGDTAEQVLGEVDCSLLVVKPEGFSTPVRLDSHQFLSRAA